MFDDHKKTYDKSIKPGLTHKSGRTCKLDNTKRTPGCGGNKPLILPCFSSYVLFFRLCFFTVPLSFLSEQIFCQKEVSSRTTSGIVKAEATVDRRKTPETSLIGRPASSVKIGTNEAVGVAARI